MRINYELTEEDLLNYNMIHANYSDTVKQSLRLQRFFVPVIFLIAPFLLYSLNDISLTYTLPYFIIMYGLWAYFYPKYFNWTIRRNVKRMLEESSNRGVIGKHGLELTQDFLIEINDQGETKKKWSTVERIINTDKYVLIYISAIQAYIIPNRSFETEKELNQFVELAKNYQRDHSLDK